MFAFFRRLKSAVSSIHTMMEKGEEPEDMLNQYVLELEQEVKDGELAMSKMIAEEKLLLKRLKEIREKIEKRNHQVIESIETGKEDFARRVLEDKLQLEREYKQLELLKDYMEKQSKEGKEKLNELKFDYQEMKIKRDMLNGKTGVANARAEIKHSTLTNYSDIGSELDREIEKVKATIKKKSERG
ncbi:PspA/IM30 family protein [Evansella tamaricis]|uniref:PspA/IM30 family protein n=1 Tax=Evansella tamaricis TaxID=2069301 RepID=A0ABS6JBQ7_9BACI|nr:PspA/IM30 family protein [Evansella tamaricis]